MSSYIQYEIFLFFQSVCIGGALLLCYNCLKVLRNIFHHSAVAEALEDLLFWLAAGFFIFGKAYESNEGSLRFFFFWSMGLGAWACSVTISSFFVKICTAIFEKPVKYVKKLIKWLLFFLGRGKIFLYQYVCCCILRKKRRMRRSKRGRQSEKVSRNKK